MVVSVEMIVVLEVEVVEIDKNEVVNHVKVIGFVLDVLIRTLHGEMNVIVVRNQKAMMAVTREVHQEEVIEVDSIVIEEVLIVIVDQVEVVVVVTTKVQCVVEIVEKEVDMEVEIVINLIKLHESIDDKKYL